MSRRHSKRQETLRFKSEKVNTRQLVLVQDDAKLKEGKKERRKEGKKEKRKKERRKKERKKERKK